MTLNKLMDTIYSFVSQNKILKIFIDFSEYITYVFVILFFLSELIPFSSLFNAILSKFFFLLFVAAVIGKKYIAIIVLLINNIICSLNKLLLIILFTKYNPHCSCLLISTWKPGISILINFALCSLALFILKKHSNN
ncbi:MAG: hypothetical protein RUMPE_01009 [Eubacteriales bacterium SKADARSKE-1]|nr:hypothetical protein [Eubacteriales bacterium SKADARSKE-1]